MRRVHKRVRAAAAKRGTVARDYQKLALLAQNKIATGFGQAELGHQR